MRNLTIIGTILPKLDAEPLLASLVAVRTGHAWGPDHRQAATDILAWLTDNVPAPTRAALVELMNGGGK